LFEIIGGQHGEINILQDHYSLKNTNQLIKKEKKSREIRERSELEDRLGHMKDIEEEIIHVYLRRFIYEILKKVTFLISVSK